MKKLTILLISFSCFFYGCKKENTSSVLQKSKSPTETIDQPAGFVDYTIYKGQQYCDKSSYVPIQYVELTFIVKFDSSAIYTSVNPVNQYDINKLYGFSDNNADHHQFSARFGWSWTDNKLWLYGYTYNNGINYSKKLGIIKTGTENYCSIKITPNFYVFTLNDALDSMERKSTTAEAVGYKLYPYFGGDETAPHDIHILIKDLP